MKVQCTVDIKEYLAESNEQSAYIKLIVTYDYKNKTFCFQYIVKAIESSLKQNKTTTKNIKLKICSVELSTIMEKGIQVLVTI